MKGLQRQIIFQSLQEGFAQHLVRERVFWALMNQQSRLKISKTPSLTELLKKAGSKSSNQLNQLAKRLQLIQLVAAL